jgi:tRNA threonylcarbamoyladenosine biosynthesis protein TsaB
MAYPLILQIETSSDYCSVALSTGEDCIAFADGSEVRNHAAMLTPLIEGLLNGQGISAAQLAAVAVSIGPGSYTGLRIGVSTAKGLCYGLDIPLMAIPTLKIIASQILPLPFAFQPMNFEAYQPSLPVPYPAPLLCPMLDARRMEVYAALYDENLNEIRPAQADIIDAGSYAEQLEYNPVIFLGTGAEKCQDVILSPNAHFVTDVFPTAQAMIPLAMQTFEQQDFVDTAYFEPFYLKEFQATIAKNKVLG